ncbi:tetratricopeptide repeat protein [Streptococcus alactolyticus]|uniref:Tetratricopeptide repeat protein n=1 Tax=Streptococcus alactolyticus TaxID=29389 RepID=A0A6N7X471_STRAY|nr:tetratricopeptide repeat protein [Streptococcus alactolyticus]MST53042.1 tetratricopeptide repeat protein [Streptococcus alactolyticus]
MLNSEKMVVSIQNQDLEHANKYFKKALKEDDDEALLELAEYLESIGFLNQAKTIYEKERASFPEVNINLAQIAAEDGDIEAAFTYLDAISPDSDAYLSALLVMADIYDMEGLADVAREKLLLASQISDDPLVTFGLAEIEMELGHFSEAIKEYAKLDNRDVLEMTGISTYQRIGKAYASLGKFEAAVEFLEKAIEIEYDDETVFELATILYDQDEFQKANTYFKQLDTMDPDFQGYEYVYALSLHEENKTEEALRMAQKGISKNAFDDHLLLLASQLAYELHDAAQSESYLLSAKEVAEDEEEVLMRLTNLYLEEERYEDVIAFAKEPIDNVLTKWNIAKAYQGLEADKKALALYNDLAADLGENPEFLHDYAYILREFGQKEHAHQVAKHYLTLVPDDVNMVEFLHEDEF